MRWPHVLMLKRAFRKFVDESGDDDRGRGGMENPIPGVRGKDLMDAMWSVDRENFKGTLQNIHLSDVMSDQGEIDVDKVEALVDGRITGLPPKVVEVKGKFGVVDGNHRIAAAILRGEEEIEAIVHG